MPRAAFAADPWKDVRGVDLELLIWDGGAFVDAMMAAVQAEWSAVGGGTLGFRKVPFGELDLDTLKASLRVEHVATYR